jgi:uridine kinase
VKREALVSAVVDGLLAERQGREFWRVGVDGVDGAGKTWLADELACEIDARGVRTVRVTLDGFHNSRERRYQRGRDSPEGFFRDSYDYDQFRPLVLDPLSPGGSGVYAPAVYDVQEERTVNTSPLQVSPEAVLIVDGIFLHRDELVSYWNYSIWVDVPFEISIPRGAARGYGFGSADPADASNRRYVEGQLLYIAECNPMRTATVIVDNHELGDPKFVRP